MKVEEPGSRTQPVQLSSVLRKALWHAGSQNSGGTPYQPYQLLRPQHELIIGNHSLPQKQPRLLELTRLPLISYSPNTQALENHNMSKHARFSPRISQALRGTPFQSHGPPSIAGFQTKLEQSPERAILLKCGLWFKPPRNGHVWSRRSQTFRMPSIKTSATLQLSGFTNAYNNVAVESVGQCFLMPRSPWS